MLDLIFELLFEFLADCFVDAVSGWLSGPGAGASRAGSEMLAAGLGRHEVRDTLGHNVADSSK